MVVLNINNVDCYYDAVKIIENVSFSVKTGSFVGILGPNGSGKTTLLKSISRILKPKKGVIMLEDQDIYTLKPVELAKKLSVVSQGTVIAFSFTALDVVLMGRSPHLSRFASESEKDVEIAKRCMAYTGTLNLADRLITELSGGERQRVIIAKALAQEPQVLLLDEPTTHLDVSNQFEIMSILRQLCNENKLLVVGVFHDFNLAANYCDSLILLKDGKIIDAGKSEKVLTPQNIKTIFGIETLVKENPITKSVYVLPVSVSHGQKNRGLTVHLICGAGTGSSLMKLLVDDGYAVTSGVLNLLDTDQETADFLKVPIIREAPLSPISETAYKTNLDFVSKSNVVILTSIPFGFGNIKNLDAALYALDLKVPTLVLNESPISLRDFTKGEAEQKMGLLKAKGAFFVDNQHDLFTTLSSLNVTLPIDKTLVSTDNKLIASHKVSISKGVKN
ncbi:MAG: ABC transporter ATP-binding protein [Candidatus Bathyarchaeia archaeon]|jgi:iron complex transport system ATP-binding protein